MARMTGGQALVRSILRQGVDTIFGLPGIQLDFLFNALHDEGNSVRVLNARHEQGTAYMAYGYAQSTGRVGAYAVVPGPGLLNTTAALATAYAGGAPVLCLTGQIASAYIGRGLGMLHEIPDQLAIMRGLTKWAARIDGPADAPAQVNEAFRQLQGGRPRPVGLEMALDIMARETEVDLADPAVPPPPPPVDMDAIESAAKLLGAATKPLIFAGGGVLGAEAELKELAEMLQAPVVSNRMGRGALSARHHLSVTHAAGHRLWADADVVLAVGSRLQQPRMTWGTGGALKVILINIDAAELNRVARPDVGLCADAKAELTALIPAVARQNRARPSREDELTALKAAVDAHLEAALAPQMAYMRALRQALPDEGILVDELTQVGYVARAAFPVYAPRTYIGSGYQGTLGFGFATALGVKVANPDKPVLSISGDGGFMFTAAELATAVQYNIPVIAVVFVDGAYGNVQRMQRELHGGRVIATDLTNPSFVALAESFGATGMHADTPATLKAAITQALDTKGPVVIEAPIGQTPDPWRHLIFGRVR